MKKFMAVILLALVIVVVLAMVWTIQKSVTSVVPEVTAYLPEATAMVFMLNSPATSAKKFDFAKYPELRQMMTQQVQGVLGFDITSASAYASKGYRSEQAAGDCFY